jgi:TM2 domain-containing membrane protein YozV
MSPEEDTGNTHHESDIDYWKHPDRSYYVFICLSFLLGFLGADHFYLRSFGTGMQKLLLNLVSFGLWYFWDVLQIIFEGEKIQAHGLNSPFDWIRGIGRGVFAKPLAKGGPKECEVEDESDKEKKRKGKLVIESKKDILVYALLTVMFGVFGLDKFYMGNIYQGLAKVFSVFNIFLFLFGIAWALWDAVHILFFTQSVLKDGITLPPPYSFLFDTIPVKGIFVPEEVCEVERSDDDVKEEANLPFGIKLPMPKIPNIVNMDSFRFLYKELAVPLLKPSVGTTIDKVQQGVAVTEKAIDVGNELASSVPKVASAVTKQIETIANPDKMIDQIKAAAAAKAAERIGAAGDQLKGQVNAAGDKLAAAVPKVPTVPTAASLLQKGGGSEEIGSGPIVAGTLTAIVLAGAVKVVAELLSQKK